MRDYMMMKAIAVYIKHQTPYLLMLIAVFVVPLALFFQFSTLELPKVQYAVLVLLFASQYVFYREKDYQKKIEKRVADTLRKELGRVPSNKEINARSIEVTYYRGVSIVIAALGVVMLMLIYQKF